MKIINVAVKRNGWEISSRGIFLFAAYERKKPMEKRKLKDLNLLDDFLFGSMVTYPEIGELFCRELLRTIFQRDFGKLTVISQKTYFGSDTDLHGARLDVYLEEEPPALPENAIIYDVEPDRHRRDSDRESLPKRVRFYHAKIDSKSLKSGEHYHSLKNVIVLMITPYDPFTRNRMVYTIQNLCVEEPDMPYEDGAQTIFLYTKGTKGKPHEMLRQLLYYMEHTGAEYAVNDSLKKIQQMVDTVKMDEEVSLNFMKVLEYEDLLREEGREEERANTERERLRAQAAEEQVQRLREEILRLQANSNSVPG